MSVMQSIMETIAKVLPDQREGPAHCPPWRMSAGLLTALTVKPKSKARRASRAEFKFDNMAYAVPVYSTIAKGKIRKIDSGPAEEAPGVLAVITHAKYTPDESASDCGFPQYRQGLCVERSSDHAKRRSALGRRARGHSGRRNTGKSGACRVARLGGVRRRDAGGFVRRRESPKQWCRTTSWANRRKSRSAMPNKAFAEAEVSVGHVYRAPALQPQRD